MSMYRGGEFLSKALPEDLCSKLDEIDCDPFYGSSKEWICTVKWKDWRRHPGHPGPPGHDAEEGLEEVEDFIDKVN
jgi:hypothetical protein